MDNRRAKKVLLIGWDAADWIVIDKLIQKGALPTLEKFLSKGVRGNIATLEPPASPILWTSIATGMLPHKHGVLGFVEPNNETGGIRPVRSTTRKVKAIWNILTQNNLKSNIVGWWPSNPAEPILGTMVSNLYQISEAGLDDPWPMYPGTVYPERLAQKMEELRIHPHELTENHLLPFIPDLYKIDLKTDPLPHQLAKMLAEAATIQAATTWLMENEEWDFTAVYFDTIDHFSHIFMKYNPPKMNEEIDEKLYEYYQYAITGIYKFHDMMLQRLLDLAGEDTTLIIMSDHGFYSDHLRPSYIPKDHGGPTVEHRPFGVFCMSGPGIKEGEKVFGTTLLDIAPTLLTLFGLPVGKDMDGKTIVTAFKEKVTPTFIDSWENVAGECGMHPDDLQENPWEAQAAMKQLIELGYIQNPGEEKNKGAAQAVIEAQLNQAKSFLSINRNQEAYEILSKLYKESKNDLRFGKHLLVCLDKLGKYKEARQIIDVYKSIFKKLPPTLGYLEGKILIGEKRYNDACEVFNELYDTQKGNPTLSLELAKTYYILDKINLAIDAFENTLLIENENPMAYYGLGNCYLKLQNYPLAIEHLLQSIEFIYHHPSAHYNLGEALALEGEKMHAINAFNVALTMSPGLIQAHKWLIKLYTEVNEPAKALEHSNFISTKIIMPNIIVSGLPRSGTSAMMQMLQMGGAAVWSDGKREADIANPKGYYELEAVKSMAQNADWLKGVNGKTIKIISHLLPFLPPENEYKIIFMERDISEVMMSQQKMLGKSAKDGYPVMLGKTLTDQVAKIKKWLERQPNIEVMFVDYASLIGNPVAHAQQIEAFTKQAFDVDKMIMAIDKDLYRNNNPKW